MTTTARPALFHRDVVGFTILAVIAIRLVPMAAAAGPSVIMMWPLAAVLFFAPVSTASVILSRHLPSTGGIYVWSKTAFGDLHGFIAAWTYWSSVLVFFPSVLLFTSSQAAFIVPGHQHLAESQTFLNSISIASVAVLLLLNLAGMRVATWYHNISALTKFVIVAIVIGLATVSWMRFGSATDFSTVSWVPSFGGLKDLLFFSSIIYMFSGAESSSQLGDEVHEAHRTIPRALVNAGVLITLIYLITSLALLTAVPASELSGLKGFATAVSISAHRLGGDSFGQWTTSGVSILLFVGHLGTVSVWLATAARLPFVIGLDRYLPPSFGRLHPHFGSPYVALITLAVATIGLIILSSLGGHAEQVYHALISLEIAIYFIPYLYLFAALIKLQATGALNDAQLTPIRKIRRYVIAAIGFVVTATALVLALIPGENIESPAKFYLMVFGSLAFNLVIGAVLYLQGKRTRPRDIAVPDNVTIETT